MTKKSSRINPNGLAKKDVYKRQGEGETIAEAIRDCLDYGKDPETTESGKYISAYECDPATVADEFLLAKASYAAMTGREQKKENNVMCYQIRQSFYPGEITQKAVSYTHLDVYKRQVHERKEHSHHRPADPPLPGNVPGRGVPGSGPLLHQNH